MCLPQPGTSTPTALQPSMVSSRLECVQGTELCRLDADTLHSRACELPQSEPEKATQGRGRPSPAQAQSSNDWPRHHARRKTNKVGKNSLSNSNIYNVTQRRSGGNTRKVKREHFGLAS